MTAIDRAEAWNARSYATRRRLLAKGDVTAEQVAFVDEFDSRALARFKAKMGDQT